MSYERDTPEPDVDENGDCTVCENERAHCCCTRCEFCSTVENDENWRVCGGCMSTFQRYWDAEQAKLLEQLRDILVRTNNRSGGRGHTYYQRKTNEALALLDRVAPKK